MYYLFVFVVLFALELVYFRVADRFNIIDRPNERSSHMRITLRGGGIVFYTGALVYFVASGFVYPWFMLGLTLIAGVSFMDDVRSVSSKLRLGIHFFAMLLMFYQWGMLELSWWYLLVVLVVCTGIINAYNFMDGINGITGGYSLVVLCGLAYVNSWIAPFVESGMIYTMIVSVVVFDFFNFRRKAKCFAGDVGSVGIAFVILFLLGKLILTTGDFSYIIFLAVYGVDSVLTIVHRLMLHENIGLPHRKHMYQLMANELKLPHLVVSMLYMLVQGVIIVIYLALPELHYISFMGSLVVLGGGYVWFIKKYFYLHLRIGN
ncbi:MULTISPECIES: MraY family glycosyltransferase [Butyricimonas]|uniref:MraY family glycosyltransferase n=1 Tax=Butyricimonas TaxID=574697 RepID=UPI0007FB5045|nr:MULTISPECIES: glycosyltransferase family 4 protein [Butyricimonas]